MVVGSKYVLFRPLRVENDRYGIVDGSFLHPACSACPASFRKRDMDDVHGIIRTVFPGMKRMKGGRDEQRKTSRKGTGLEGSSAAIYGINDIKFLFHTLFDGP